MMNNLVAAIEYDGTKFQGSQKQPNVRTVQGAFDKSLTLIHKENVISEFASRTDSGVHAQKQVVSFKSNLDITDDSWVDTLNYNLPKDIRVFKCNRIEKNIDVRRDAIEREYTYRMILGERISPIEYNYYEHLNHKLNFSILDSSELLINYTPNLPASNTRVYALNYNILNVKNGMGGIAYSN